MNTRFNTLIEISAHFRGVLKCNLSDVTRRELEAKLDLAVSELAEIVKKEAVIV